MKRALALLLSTALSVSVFAASDPADPKPAAHKTTKSRTATASEVQELRDALAAQQRQIEELKQMLQSQAQAAQQAQQQASQAQSAAGDASSKADAANAVATKANDSVSSVQTDVTDLKANSTSAALSLQEEQKRIGAMESPVAIHFKGITITPGGFIAAETVTRQRGTASDVNTPFNSIPFAGANAANLTEFFGSGRQSRITLLAEGKLASYKLAGYYEADWLSAGVTSNNNQSNSYTNRQRQIWGQVATNSGWQITGGQQWSLATETKKGLDNRSEALPMTIDAQYTVGFSWARQFGLRVTRNFNNKLWLGMSVEDPQTIFANATNSPNNFVLGNAGTGGGLYNPTANYSFNAMPDLIFKAAVEPGWGHYEVFGIVRRFRDRVYPNAGATPAAATAAFNDSRMGGGIGVNARGTVAKKIDVGIHFLAGDGVGRYGTAGLPDATVHPDGTLALLHSYQALGTLEYHTTHWDWYANAGGEYVARAFYLNSAGKLVGYGVPTADNSGCGAEVLPGAGGFAPSNPGKCAGNTRNLMEGTFGFWYKPYNGPKGRIQFGPQYSYVVRNTWAGTGGTPNAIENMVFTSFRYYLP